MTGNDLRQKYLDFFASHGHKIIPSAPLVPENDPTTLFTGSGMQPMVPYLLGQTHPLGTRLVDSQKCFRSQDIEEVGDNRHDSFFEMLGNWSLGDYFKTEQLTWFFEFLTTEIGLDPQRLYVTTFIGDEKNHLPRDTESVSIWKQLFASKGIAAEVADIGSEAAGYERGIKEGERIFTYESKKNWWSRAGVPENMPAGEPGGPDSEVFYDFGTPHDPKWGDHCHPNCDCGRFLEIGNSVFMQYLKLPDGSFTNLPKQNVDFGGGLERLVMAATNNPDIIAVNHRPILDYLEKASGKAYGADEKETHAFRVIADHMKASVFLIADGVIPSNKAQGYFLRRLLRRSLVKIQQLGISDFTPHSLVSSVISIYQSAYPELLQKQEEVQSVISQEIARFSKTLAKGMREFSKLSQLNGKTAFDLFQTYGFPLEVTLELAAESQRTVDQAEFKAEFAKHQELSRTASKGMFKGGLQDQSEITTKYHTATHLLHKALRDVLGTHVQQKGSNITSERLRFDFSHSEKLTPEQIKAIEQEMNAQIAANLPVHHTQQSKSQALSQGALAFFPEKYPETASVYTIGDPDHWYSKELCGGPHVNSTGEIGNIKIIKEESAGAGVRRIYAKLSQN